MRYACLVVPMLLLSCPLRADLLEHVRFFPDNPPATPVAAAGVVVLGIPRVSAAPVLDGELNDACWQDKQASLGAFRLGLSSTLARHRREAWACYDDQTLYLAVRLQRKPGQPLRVLTKADDDGKIWEDDEIEIFLDPFGTGSEYYQIIINSGGFRFDAAHRYVTVLDPAGAQPTDTKRINEADPAWASGLQRRIAVHEQDWTAEMALPLAAIGLAGAPVGHNVRFNVTSADWDTNEYTCLSPCSDWHDPLQFGTLVLGQPVVAVTELVLEQVGFGRNLLALKVRNLTAQPVSPVLALTCRTEVGTTEKRLEFELQAGVERRVSLVFDTVARKGPWTADIRLLSDTGQPLFAGRRAGEIPEPLMLRLGSQGTFTGNAPVVVAAHLGLGSESARTTALTATLVDAQSRVVSKQELGLAQCANLSAQWPMDDIGPGRYVLRLTASLDRQTLATAEAVLLVAASPFDKR